MSFVRLLRRALWLACIATILLVPCARAAESPLTADFDGDGRHDSVAIDRQDPSILHVWLSATGFTEPVRNSRPLLRVAAADLDGDYRPELIATDSSTIGLRVWKTHGRRGFRPYRLGLPPSRGFSPPGRRTVDDDSSAVPAGLFGSRFVQHALSSRGDKLPRLLDRLILQARPDGALPSSHRFSPTAPRPPPVFLG